jgi:hypothetical protein
MAIKKNVNEEELLEFKSSDEQSVAADPHNGGDSSRSADKSAGETTYAASTKSEVLNAIMQTISGLNKDQLADVFKGLEGASGSSARAADKTSGETGQISLSPTSVKPVTGAPMAGADKSSSTGSGEKGQIRTAPTSAVAKEDVEDMFAGEELTEELKERAVVVFEAAVGARLVSEVARLEEEFEALLEESIEEIRSEIVENVDKYLSYAVEQWVEENIVAIDTGLKSEMAEELIVGLKNIFEANYIEIPETKVDVVAEMTDHIEELQARLSEEIEKNIALEQVKEELEVADIFDTISEGLAKTQAEKLRVLAEGITYESADDFAHKVNIIKESYFPSTKTASRVLTEETFDASDEDYSEPTGQMAAYINAVNKSVKK